MTMHRRPSCLLLGSVGFALIAVLIVAAVARGPEPVTPAPRIIEELATVAVPVTVEVVITATPTITPTPWPTHTPQPPSTRIPRPTLISCYDAALYVTCFNRPEPDAERDLLGGPAPDERSDRLTATPIPPTSAPLEVLRDG